MRLALLPGIFMKRKWLRVEPPPRSLNVIENKCVRLVLQNVPGNKDG
jgi:hypothetical protein